MVSCHSVAAAHSHPPQPIDRTDPSPPFSSFLRVLRVKGFSGKALTQRTRRKEEKTGAGIEYDSLLIPAPAWTIISFPRQMMQGSAPMRMNRKLRALLIGCMAFGVVVRGGMDRAAAQSRPSKSINSHVVARNMKPAVRAD